MMSNDWIAAAVALGGGILLGRSWVSWRAACWAAWSIRASAAQIAAGMAAAKLARGTALVSLRT